MSEKLDIFGGPPSSEQLKNLSRRCKAAFKVLKSVQSEARLPIFIEVAGSPKSGKSTVIGIITHFLKRHKVNVVQPPEGASLRTPSSLKDDWLAFNAWSGCYALQSILEDSFLESPVDVVILDRGLFDFCAWMDFLYRHEKRISQDDRKRAIDFFTIDLWRRRENIVFFFTADHQTSLARENDSMLTTGPGSMMKADKLGNLLASYNVIADEIGGLFNRLVKIDTSFKDGQKPSFQQIAFIVAEKIVEILDDLGTQNLLVTETVDFEGFVTDARIVEKTRMRILKDDQPHFMPRAEAEKTTKFQQVVPYALLKNDKGRYFFARRRADSPRKVLRKKLTCLVGGHAELRDWDDAKPQAVFERCLRRELEEELVGIHIKSISPLGFVSDTRSDVGRSHLAYMFEVEVGGNVNIRRQAIDKEFGREAVDWVDGSSISQRVAELDPWSQLVAVERFGATLPPSDQLFD